MYWRMNGSKKYLVRQNEDGANGVCSFKNEEFKIVDMLSHEYPVKDICKMMGSKSVVGITSGLEESLIVRSIVVHGGCG